MPDLIYPRELTRSLKELYALAWTPWVLRDVWLVLRAYGDPIATKAEDEGAAAIHFLMPFVLEHPDDWRARVGDRIAQMRDEIVARG